VPALRLPSDARPLSEKLSLEVAPDKPRFSGTADIVVLLDAPRRVLWLHGKGLHVSRTTLTPEGGQPLPGQWAEVGEHGTASVTLDASAPAGRATLHVEYDAAVSEGRTGLFRASEANVPHLFTQLEATYARNVFPCFDEPGFKIPWSLTLDVPAGAQAISNTPEAERTNAPGGGARVRFAETKPLPSYLLAFAVGPFEVLSGADAAPNSARARPLPLRIVAPKGHAKELAYALAHSGEILSTLEQYFGIAYPYEKLDLIAIPGGQGAMENPGAVTFDEPLLVFDEKNAPLSQKQDYAYVVAHELAHQWFGDLVTMQWWDDTWLNESFATWMGSKAADAWRPASEARMSLLGGIQGAIGTDSLVSARAIRQPIQTVDDIENAFDNTTYQKGGGVLSMFERYLGEDAFRAGVRLHLSQHAYGSATADDFLGALGTAAKRDVKIPMHTFLDQPGVPFIEAESRCDGSPRLHLKQSRFLPRGSTGDANRTWQVPVCAKYPVKGGVKESCTLLVDREGDLPFEGGACPAWVFPNADAAGYYRFALAPADLAKLRSAGLGSLSPREKIAFGNSIRAAYNHGTTPYAESLRTAATLVNDPNRQVAREAQNFIDSAREWLRLDPALPRLETYASKLYAASFSRLGWAKSKTDDPQTIDRRRDTVRFLANVARDKAVRAEAKRKALAFLGFGKDGAIHRDAVDADLVGIVLGVAGQDADPALFDAMLALFAKSDDPMLRADLLRALGSARDPALGARAIGLALDPRLRPSEVFDPIWDQLGPPETREAAWTWFKQNWDAVWARVSANLFVGGNAMRVVEVFCDEVHAADAANFLGQRAKSIEGAPRELAKALEDVHLCVVKRAAEEGHAREFFLSEK
jgi:alanyl aminopeptidase